MGFDLGSLFSGGLDLLGGYLNDRNQQNINNQNIASQQQINQQNLAAAQMFAQNGIQWKVQDAQRAGINPLAALGATTTSPPTLVGAPSTASPGMGAGVAAAGQDIGRAIQSMQSPEDQAVAAMKTKMDLESQQLDNDIKRASLASSIAKHTQPGTPPGVRTGGFAQANVVPDVGYSRTAQGGLAPSMSEELQKQNYGVLGEFFHSVRNRLTGGAPPPMSAGRGAHWRWDPFTQQWLPERAHDDSYWWDRLISE